MKVLISTLTLCIAFSCGLAAQASFYKTHISAADIAACESWELTLRKNYLHLETVGLGGGIYWRIHLSLEDGLLVLETAAGC